MYLLNRLLNTKFFKNLGKRGDLNMLKVEDFTFLHFISRMLLLSQQ